MEPTRKLSLAGVLAFVLAAVVHTAKGSEGYGESTAWDSLATALVLVGIGFLVAGALVLLRRRAEGVPPGSRSGAIWTAAAVWVLGVVPIIYLGFRSEDGRDGPCSSTGDFVGEHYVPGADVRTEDVSFPPGAVRCVVETPTKTYSRVSPDSEDAAISLLLAVMPFGLWPLTRRLAGTDGAGANSNAPPASQDQE